MVYYKPNKKRIMENSLTDFVEVALAADKNYIVGLTVAACSIARSCSSGISLRFHILFSGFTEKDKANIQQKLLSSKSNREVCFYDVSDIDFSDSSGKNVVLHYAGEAPWKATFYTHLITDTQLLWFDACSLIFNESLWQSLRRFYSPFAVVKARLLFTVLFKIWPMSIFGKLLLKHFGIKNFRESLQCRKQYLKAFDANRSGK